MADGLWEMRTYRRPATLPSFLPTAGGGREKTACMQGRGLTRLVVFHTCPCPVRKLHRAPVPARRKHKEKEENGRDDALSFLSFFVFPFAPVIDHSLLLLLVIIIIIKIYFCRCFCSVPNGGAVLSVHHNALADRHFLRARPRGLGWRMEPLDRRVRQRRRRRLTRQPWS